MRFLLNDTEHIEALQKPPMTMSCHVEYGDFSSMSTSSAWLTSSMATSSWITHELPEVECRALSDKAHAACPSRHVLEREQQHVR